MIDMIQVFKHCHVYKSNMWLVAYSIYELSKSHVVNWVNSCIRYNKPFDDDGDDALGSFDRKKVVGGLILLGRFLHGPWLALLLLLFFSHTLRSSSVVRMLVQRFPQRRRLFSASTLYRGSLASMCWTTKALKGGRKAPRPSNTGPSSSVLMQSGRAASTPRAYVRSLKASKTAKNDYATTCCWLASVLPLKSQRNMTWW